MKGMSDTALEVLVIKYSLGTVFLGVTLTFVIKIGMLMADVVRMKVTKLGLWIHDGGLTEYVKEIIHNAITGG